MDVENVRLLGREAFYRLAVTVERRSGEVGSHSRRTSKMVAAVTEQLGLEDASRGRLIEASLFHDIGKIAVPHRILARTGTLDAEDRAVVETHCEIGSWLLRDRGCPVLDVAARIAVEHHENVDGSGYPYGLAGEEISFEARVVHVCDVFDALTSDRTYRPAFTVAEALRMVVADAGQAFDPEIVDALTAVVPDWRLCAA
jgi:HD-GYP domain-containing protein (c-di-GMP phosphodiesterase class II)